MLLTKTFSEAEFARALHSWTWLDLDGKRPVVASLFGDVFFLAADGYWFLSTLEGSLSREWANRDDLQAALDTEEGQDQYLLSGLAVSGERRGLRLGPLEVYAWQVPPILGGSFAIENITVLDFVVWLTICGQLHRQVKDLPPGTKISGFSFAPDDHWRRSAGRQALPARLE